MSYSVSLGVWRLGGVASQGDVNLSAEAIAHQVQNDACHLTGLKKKCLLLRVGQERVSRKKSKEDPL